MSKQYKHTLNLPHTKFPMKASLAQREPHWLEYWQSIDLYEKIRTKYQGRDTFILHDGPPYANGHIHMGHVFNKVFKDIVVKQKTLSGLNAAFVPGWDCHGLPIELHVERQLTQANKTLSKQAFRQACRDYAAGQIANQAADFKRLAVFGDWSGRYATMDFSFEANVLRILGQLIDKGYVVRRFKPVYWCLDCQSALAEAELEYEMKSSTAIDVGFKILDKRLFTLFDQPLNESIDYVLPIWTTTPWTLPANEAVAVHPDQSYSLIQTTLDGVSVGLLVGTALLSTLADRWSLVDYQVLGQVPGRLLELLQLQHPLADRQVPVILADHVSAEDGTGAVHTAPSHGLEDYQVGMHYHLPLTSPVLASGYYHEETPHVAGLHIFEAIDTILTVLNQRRVLIHQEQIEHSYPHCWRHKTPVIYRATPQWFIDMDACQLRANAMQVAKHVQWLPSWGEQRMLNMLENRPDWCISRQRLWGSPMPLFIHKKDQSLHPKTVALIETIADRVEQHGIDVWDDLTAESLLGTDAADYQKVTDTLDVWFDAGVSHACVLAKNDQLTYPADLYLEGTDQYRGWFQSSLLTSVALHGQAPYQAVLTHGFITDPQGRKMSKSLGNIIKPSEITEHLGADILRLWVASTDYRSDISVSDEILKRLSEAYRRIRNTARYLLANLFDFDPNEDQVPLSELLALDKWALNQAWQVQQNILQAYEEYQFHKIYQMIHNFCTVDMGGFYLDVIKDRQYTSRSNSRARRSCQTTMYHIIESLVRWLAPILSFTAEEIWQHLPGQREESVFLSTWYQRLEPIEDLHFSADHWRVLLELRSKIYKVLEQARIDRLIGSSLDALVIIYANPSLQDFLKAFGDELHFILITSGVQVMPYASCPADVEAIDQDLAIVVQALTDEKCERCWHRRADVGQDVNYSSLCQRCVNHLLERDRERIIA